MPSPRTQSPCRRWVNEIDASFNRGDTLMNVMTRAGVDRGEAHKAIQALSKLFNPREIKAGQKLSLTLEDDPDSGEARLTRLSLKADKTREIVVRPVGDKSFTGEAVDIPLTTELVRSQGIIDSSLYAAAVKSDVPLKVLADMINIFSFDVDFQREVQRNDSFSLMYERLADDQGNAVDHGEVLLAEMTLSGEQRRFYRYKDSEGFIDYYDEKGRSVRKALLKTPIDGARISSRYGKRKHPILGYTKKHSGVDFAAPARHTDLCRREWDRRSCRPQRILRHFMSVCAIPAVIKPLMRICRSWPRACARESVCASAR